MRQYNPNIYIITGGPGAGKTTVLRELEKLGYACLPEVARQIIQEQVQAGGSALPWHDREAYTQLMLDRSIESYLQQTADANPTFADRGIPDTLAYANLIHLPDRDHLERACQEHRYATRVFLAPPWKAIYETDTERKQDFDEAVRTFAQIRETYIQCGYEPVILPKASPQERAEFIVRSTQTDSHPDPSESRKSPTPASPADL